MDNEVYQKCISEGKSVEECTTLAMTATMDKSNADAQAQIKQLAKDTYYRRNLGNGLSTLGLAGGLFFAYKKQKHFWGYVGFGLLFSIGGGAVGYFVGSMIDKPNENV